MSELDALFVIAVLCFVIGLCFAAAAETSVTMPNDLQRPAAAIATSRTRTVAGPRSAIVDGRLRLRLQVEAPGVAARASLPRRGRESQGSAIEN
jgi:hypothetical protein